MSWMVCVHYVSSANIGWVAGFPYRLLQEYVEKHGNGMEVVYALSGWLKNNPSVYHIRLVSGPKLSG